MTRMNWDDYGLEIAETAASRSEDPFLKVGACVFREDKSIVGIGYNGAASGVDIDWSDRDKRRLYVIHAEVNALRYCTPDQTKNGFLYSTHLPCIECIKVIASYGIKNIMYRDLIDNATYDLYSIYQLGVAYKLNLTQKQKVQE